MKEYQQQQVKKKILVGESWLPDTQAVIDNMPNPLSQTEKREIERFITSLQNDAAGDIYAVTDDIYSGCFSDDANKLTGWKTGILATTRAGSPTSINGGFRYDGIDDCHDFKFVAGAVDASKHCVWNDACVYIVLLDTPPIQTPAKYMFGWRKRYGDQSRAMFYKQDNNLDMLANAFSSSNQTPSHTYQKGIYALAAEVDANRIRFNKTQLISTNLIHNANENAKWYMGNVNDQTSSGSLALVAGAYGSLDWGMLMFRDYSSFGHNNCMDYINTLFQNTCGITLF
jgi:hypothetical protein